MQMQGPRTEFAQAIRAIAGERNLDPEVILETIRQAIIAAYKHDAKERGEETEGFDYEVKINPSNGEARVFSWPVPVAVEGEEDAEKPEVKAEPSVPVEKKDVTPPGFGRIAAGVAKQVIHQKIREAEKGAIMDEFSVRVGNLISGMILRFDGSDVRVDLGRTEGLMPAEERVMNERLNPNQRLTFLLKDIVETLRGKQIILSRADPNFVKKLFEREVPEIGSGSVEIKAITREAGVRTKIAVYSNQSGVDPVGSCVGQKGIRVQAVTNELGGERVDIIPWSEDLAELIKASLSPAEGITVKLDKKNNIAKVKAPEDQLSLAIGKDGQNVRLASKLTGWRIEVEELPLKKEKVEEDKSKKEVEKEKKEVPESEIEKVEKKEDVKVDDQPQVQATTDETKETKPETVVEEKPKEDQATEQNPEKANP